MVIAGAALEVVLVDEELDVMEVEVEVIDVETSTVDVVEGVGVVE